MMEEIEKFYENNKEIADNSTKTVIIKRIKER